jgi:hypothetical protein
MLSIYYDSRQEGRWFQDLHSRLSRADLRSMTGAIENNPCLSQVLAYDRPDVILVDGEQPILMVERTEEVPSGHNVGQRFARMAAAAQGHVPLLYFCPYAARKHGGKTAGPRYMNLRLFHALDKMRALEQAAIETINWPVNAKYEIVKGSRKDERVRAYLNVFFQLYDRAGIRGVNEGMAESVFHQEQIEERGQFIRQKVKNARQYDGPPHSVKIDPTEKLARLRGVAGTERLPHPETVLYKVGMKKIRSDPYTGMGMLYEYLYAGGAARPGDSHFPSASAPSPR